MKEVTIIPTGDEVCNGLVIDTNSPAMMAAVVEHFPCCRVVRTAPVADSQQEIVQEILRRPDSDLILIIGGSGGGRLYDPSLAVDVTHHAVEQLLPDPAVQEIYGFNGHLWSRLVVGRIGNTLVANVPGPHTEAVAATRALLAALVEGMKPAQAAKAMAQAVLATYPKGGAG
jgi:molybdopterin biosynthesis enzyme